MYYPRYSKFPYHNDDKFVPVTEKKNYNYYKYYPVKINKHKNNKYNKCIIL
jgi:hypothetical protein